MTHARSLRLLQLLIVPVVLVVVVWFATMNSTSIYFPPLADVLTALKVALTEGELMDDLVYSMRNLLAGLAIAAAVGGIGGLVIGIHPATRDIVMPFLNFMRSTPHVAFVPVIILGLGIGAAPKILLISFSTVWPIIMNTISGVRSINPAILETSASFRVPWTLQMRKVVMPGALPQFMAGLRVAVAVGLVLVVISEIYGSAEGVGYFILRSSQNFAVTDTWAGTLLIGMVGYLLSLTLLSLEYLLLGWYDERPPRHRVARPRTPQRNGSPS